MTKRIKITDFNVDVRKIPKDINTIVQNMPSKQRYSLDKEYGSAKEFLTVLFDLRFNKKLEKSEISARLGLKPPNLHAILYNFHWDLSSDYKENNEKFEYKLEKLRSGLAEAKEKSRLLDINQYDILKIALEPESSYHKDTFYKKLGSNNKEEYIRLLFYLIFIEGYQTRDLALLFNISVGTTHDRLRTLGFNLSLEEGIKRKTEQSTQDYLQTFRSNKKTRLNSQLRNLSSGSKNEDVLRKYLSLCIHDPVCLDNKKYEVIVGLSNAEILDGLEIDIPVVIFNIEEHEVFRFAIEYNDTYLHKVERDNAKESIAKSKDWIYLPIVESSETHYSNKPEELRIKAQELIDRMLQIMKTIPIPQW